MRLIDHAAGRVGADAARAAGFDGAIRYLANSPDRGLPNKILLPDEAARYLELGMPLVSNWQRGKHATADWRRGFAGGVEDAQAAQAHHAACGGPDHAPIYFSVDEDVNLSTWNSLVLPYLNGAASVIGRHRVGVYGGQRSMWWADEDGFPFRWQTKSWSRYDAQGRWNSSLPVQWVPGCQLRQERVDEDRINGIGIDVNTVWATDFGQWQYDRSPVGQERPVSIKPNPGHRGDPLFLPDVLRAFGLKVWEDPGWRTRGHGDFNQIQGVIAHHTAGGGSNDWLVVRDGRTGLAGPLSQLVLEKDGTYRVVAAGVAWHAGSGSWRNWPKNNANWTTIGIEAVSKGTPPYDWTAAQLDAYVRGVGAILWYLGLDANSVAAHREYSSEGKIDPAGIDMGWFRSEVQKIIDAGPSGDSEEAELMAIRFKNYKGTEVDIQTVLFYMDKHVNEIREQLGGPKPFTGWPQLGDKTVVDSLADAHNKIDALTACVQALVDLHSKP